MVPQARKSSLRGIWMFTMAKQRKQVCNFLKKFASEVVEVLSADDAVRESPLENGAAALEGGNGAVKSPELEKSG